MSARTVIANLAISHLGIGKDIADLETERSQEALTCKRFFDLARDTTLRDFPWPFAGTIQTLPLVSASPNVEWGYSYRYPTDCLYVRRLLSGFRNDSHETRQPYKIIQDTTGILILTDLPNAQLEYTVRIEDTLLYPPDFMLALSYFLASLIAPRIMAGDNLNVGAKMLQMYQLSITKASIAAVNEEQVDQAPESEFIRARNDGSYHTFRDLRNPF